MSPSNPEPVIAIHGGAGTINRDKLDAQGEAAYHAALRGILQAAQARLLAGATALEAVTLAVELLEESPLFNAGVGAVFTRAETHELDAAVMDGATLRAGAVAGVSHVRRPVRAALAVLEHGEHVLLAGVGAEDFARAAGLEMVDPGHFSTEVRRAQLHAALAKAAVTLDHDGGAAAPLLEGSKLGTVGAVALDRHGHLAAATSTGGMTNKRVGRIGDSPLIGAGTYADDRSAAVSCTGAGEYFIRAAVAHDLCARMAYGGATLEDAAQTIVMQVLPALGGRGGLIAVDAGGRVSMPFNTEGMYRGMARGAAPPQTAIYRDDAAATDAP